LADSDSGRKVHDGFDALQRPPARNRIANVTDKQFSF
jgi:hypothetical protein